MNRMAGGHKESSAHESSADRAVQWFVLLRSGCATFADRREFQLWIDADAVHRKEFDRCASLWDELDSAKPLLRKELARVALDWERVLARPGFRTVWSWSSVRFSSVLAALVVVVIMAGWWFTTGFETGAYRTAKGERRIVTLSDGSVVTLNTGTVMTTAFSRSKRAVSLLEGEALFSVSHAGGRPFEVLAGNRIVRDIGTQFVVRMLEQSVMVTVVEGAVEVQRSEASSDQVWQRLTAGEQLAYGLSGAISPVKPVSLAEATAWIDGKIMFEDRPLSEVIQEVGRYQRGEIRILDPRIGALKVSGVFEVDDRMGFLNALERAAPVVVSYVNGAVVVLEEKRSVPE
ncbi:MAG: FecR family protein [Nitrospira sp.]|nr:FecR family protein [Nitrospira sp.]